MYRGGKKGETVGLYPRFWLKRSRRSNNEKMIINTITQMQDKIKNVTQDQMEF